MPTNRKGREGYSIMHRCGHPHSRNFHFAGYTPLFADHFLEEVPDWEAQSKNKVPPFRTRKHHFKVSTQRQDANKLGVQADFSEGLLSHHHAFIRRNRSKQLAYGGQSNANPCAKPNLHCRLDTD